MKFKNLFVLLVLFCMLSFSAVFAQDSTFVETKMKVGDGTIRFRTWNAVHYIDYRCLPKMVIDITESEQGLLKQGKSIYMRYDSDLTIENYVDIKASDENVLIKGEIDIENHIIRIDLKKVNSSKQLEFRVETTPYISREIGADGKDLFYGISLITGKEYKDNLFYDMPEEENSLNEHFLRVTKFVNDFTVKKIKTVALTAGEHSIYMKGIENPLSTPAYIDENNQMMVPVKEVVKNSGMAEIEWDTERNSAVIKYESGGSALLTPGSESISINNIVYKLSTPIEVKNGVMYMQAKDLATAIGLRDTRVLWDEKRNSIQYLFDENS